ncbi:MAG: FAD-dependent oxidoreductase [Actinobacteria bacterium]|nr:FAD-dependent oxidoreductase [Actinomycetota bacterium]
MTQSPVIVVGGGIIGSAIARQLQRSGVETTLVERDLEPQGASVFSFASLSAFAEPDPDMYSLKCLGMSDWRRWEREIAGDIGLRWDGEVRWAQSAASEVTQEHGRELLDQAALCFPSLARAKLHRVTAESRPVPRDGMPIIGPLPGMRSLNVPATHFGVTLAPVLSRLATQELNRRPAGDSTAAMPAARFYQGPSAISGYGESALDAPSELFLG